jgi:SnoaL-like domain
VDWEAFARTVEQAQSPDAMVTLYAVGATYRDPITPTTTDVRAVAEQTFRVFPDWHQRIERIRGGNDWAVFEWTGSGTYRGPGAEDGPGFPVCIGGATIVEVDGDGLITAFRDFPDVYASMQQITAGLHAAGGAPPAEDAIFAD